MNLPLSTYKWRMHAYTQWRLKANDAHGIHSPFIFNLYNEVIKGNKAYSLAIATECGDIEKIRKTLSVDKSTQLQVNDYGTGGSPEGKTRHLSLSELVKMSSTKAEGELFYRLARFHNAKNIIELGTNMGLGTAYFKKGAPNAQPIISLEGCANVAAQALKHWQQLFPADDVPKQVIGNIDITLATALHLMEGQKLSLVYFDANHSEEATLKYFHLLVKHTEEESLFIFDDIRYSPGMLAAWEQIKEHPRVRQTVDLCDIGLAYFRNSQAREHFFLKG